MDSMSILYELKILSIFSDEKRVLSIDNLILEENKIIGFLDQTVVENLHFFLFYLLFLNHK